MTTAINERRVSRQRQLGAYYTPASAAEYMANWILRRDEEDILEPSFGDGAFLRALNTAAAERGLNGVRVTGVELDSSAAARAVEDSLLHPHLAVCDDFMAHRPRPMHGVVGNPPYVRLRHLSSPDERQRALDVARERIPGGMEPSGSLWMPFVVHSANFLRIGGRLALVLPYEMTYVRYARPLWRFLGANFADLRVVRVFDRVFPDILQDVVLLFADGHGSSTGSVTYETFESVEALVAGEVSTSVELDVQRLIQGQRDFVAALLPQELRGLLERLETCTRPMGELARLNIGYVSGDKTFFHPSSNDIVEFALPSESLIPAVTTTRSLRGRGLYTSQLPADNFLFRPSRPTDLTAGEIRYVAHGESREVHQRYKCRIRDPWFVVPGVLQPDLVLSVFSSTPLLVVNDQACVASNSLLCGYALGGAEPTVIAASWYTSLTLLQCELRVHSLGGGVLVMIPGEASQVRVASATTTSHLEQVNTCLMSKDVAAAYRVGDDAVLRGDLGLSSAEVDLIREGVRILARWREDSRVGPALA